jgi:predicted RNase H-like HicB family nuclease
MVCEILPKYHRMALYLAPNYTVKGAVTTTNPQHALLYYTMVFNIILNKMKKTLTLVALAAVNLAAFAQEITFKPDFKPNSTYVQKTNIDMMMDMEQEGQGNMEQPMAMSLTYTTKTGKALANGDVPFTSNMKMENESAPNLDEINNNKYYGHFTKAGLPIVDSVTVGATMAEAKEDLKKALAKALSQFPAEGKKLKVGESFQIKDLPLDMGGLDLSGANLAITYTLKKVEGNKATFDVLMDNPLDINAQGANMKGNIKLTGTMNYLTDAKYIPSQDMLMDMNLSIAQAGVSVNMKGKTTVTTTVTAN